MAADYVKDRFHDLKSTLRMHAQIGMSSFWMHHNLVPRATYSRAEPHETVKMCTYYIKICQEFTFMKIFERIEDFFFHGVEVLKSCKM